MTVTSTRVARGRLGLCAIRAYAASCFTLPLFATTVVGPGTAQAQTPPAEAILITASRTPQALASVLADVSVIERADIERSGVSGVADLLARLPGVQISRSGGIAGTTNVFVRGSEGRHTAVYVDGVRLDSQSTGGTLWEQLPLDQIDRIEVLRGPAAALYGSDAVAGVVQLFTRRGQGALRPTASASVGSHGTAQAQAGISGGAGPVDYALSASHGRSDGFNARTLATANPDDDGWRRNAVQARLGWQAHADHRLEASLLATRLRSRYDSSATADDVSHHTLRTTSLGWTARWTDSATTRVSAGQSQSTYETQPNYYRTETTLRNHTLLHEQRFGSQVITGMLERRDDELLNPATAFATPLKGERHQDAIGLGWRGDFGDHGLQAQVRHDQDSEFGGKNTGSLAWGWRVAPQWRITAAAATSFRVPTLYQRFSQYGNPALVPESGRNVELGLRWSAAGSALSLSTWRNQISNLIAFGPPGPCADGFGCYVNIGRARLEGLTLAGHTQLGAVTLRGSFDLHDPVNVDSGKLLARRARQFGTLAAETTWAGWTLVAELQGSGERFENATNTQRLGGYGLVNLFVSRPLLPGLTLEARLDNAADKAYELARTYATGGRSGQLALRWAPR